MSQYAIITDLNLCVGCHACTVACKAANGVEIGAYWNKVVRVGPNPKFEGAHFPDVEMYFLPVGCQHCENPECVKVCPTGASQKMADGTVQIDKSKCIGCQFCVMACPYEVRYLNSTERVIEKCTLCEQRTSQGMLPACVEQCGARARFFGDAEKGYESFEGPARPGDCESRGYEDVRDARCKMTDFVAPFAEEEVHHLDNVGNDPSFAYILRNHSWKGTN